MTTSPITITAELLDDLQRKAKAAHPQAEWFRIIDMKRHSNVDLPAAKHIAAASPAVVDALVEHIRSLTERLEMAEKAIAPFSALARTNFAGSIFDGREDSMIVLWHDKTGVGITLGDFRQAAAIAQEGAEHE